MEYNFYCDETCHLEHDKSNVMALGTIWVEKERVKDINYYIKVIKEQAGFNPQSEAKWTKICKKHLNVYTELINYFFDESTLHFRCVLIPHKEKLEHKRYHQSHDEWYYKMYFNLLKTLLSPDSLYNIYIDIKDTHSYEKAQKLFDVCSNNMYDFSHLSLKKIQPIRSEEVEIMQLVDILIGAIAYNSRIFSSDHHESESKREIINLIKRRSRYSLTYSTPYREDKFNLFVWKQDYNTGELYHDSKL